MTRHLFKAALLTAAISACSSASEPSDTAQVRPNPAPIGAPWQTLSEWRLFSDIEGQIPSEGVIPFEVISVLYADDAEKHRFLYLPPGGKIGWKDTERWDFPVGTILVKTFSYPRDARAPEQGVQALETRLLVHEAEGAWAAHVYVYGDSPSEALHVRSGRTLEVDRIDEQGTLRHERYNVPTEFDCESCHGIKADMRPLGPRTRQMDREHDYGQGLENQIDYLARLGSFDTTPSAERQRLADPFGDGPIVERARSFMDANCAHCHSLGGKSDSTGYWINYENTDPVTGNPSHWGVCKFPTSAGNASGGLTYDIVPGNPDASIVIHRMASTEPRIKMPPLLTRRADERGIQVLREWIASMPPNDCE
jgi:uncharacterized repeat protein (TIGR03806 family)